MHPDKTQNINVLPVRGTHLLLIQFENTACNMEVASIRKVKQNADWSETQKSYKLI